MRPFSLKGLKRVVNRSNQFKLTSENGIQYNKESLSKVGRECRNELINRRSCEENANMVFFHVWLLAAGG
jgi:hypothetical protein